MTNTFLDTFYCFKSNKSRDDLSFFLVESIDLVLNFDLFNNEALDSVVP